MEEEEDEEEEERGVCSIRRRRSPKGARMMEETKRRVGVEEGASLVLSAAFAMGAGSERRAISFLSSNNQEAPDAVTKYPHRSILCNTHANAD